MSERIALISDIHGNSDALGAVLRDCRDQHIAKYFCLGDLAFNGPFPAEAVDMVRSLRAVTVIRGNTDEALELIPEGESVAARKILWTRDELGKDRLRFLNELPLSAEIKAGNIVIRGFHASPEDPGRVLDETSPEEEFSGFFKYRADLYCYGHIHRSLFRWIARTPFVNPGAVGFAIGADPMPHYAIIEADGDAVSSVDLRRVVYDADRAIERGSRAGMPGFDMMALDWKNGRK